MDGARMAEALAAAARGEPVDTRVDAWHIYTWGEPARTRAEYKVDGTRACYDFLIRDEQELEFFNTHRLATKGLGTPTLLEVERALRLLAMRGKPVKAIFDPFGQLDTENWLRKNQYEAQDGVYIKRF